MRIAVVTLTRDRLDYTQQAFASLVEHAGCDYDHYVLDQDSTDGTGHWLRENWGDDDLSVIWAPRNLGISKGLNHLIDHYALDSLYDVIVKFDNDCLLRTPGTLAACAAVAHTGSWLASPVIRGLNNPPAIPMQSLTEVAGYQVAVPEALGGIFTAMPAHLFRNGYRHDQSNPPWGGEDVKLTQHWRSIFGQVGYLVGYSADHIDGTLRQYETHPDYRARSLSEGHP